MNVSPIKVLKQAFADFVEDRAMSWAAAIAFFTALSFAPLILLLISVTDWIGEETRDGVIREVSSTLGPQAGEIVQTVAKSANQSSSSGMLSFVIGIAVTLFSASSVFAQLQVALNIIWEVRVKPGNGLVNYARKRLLSMGMVLGLAFLFIATLAVSAVIDYLLPSHGVIGRIGSAVVSLVLFVPLFAAMFRYLPDAKIAWRDVIEGAVVTAILFMIGKSLIGLYLSTIGVGSAYGAAGSLLVLLVWMYYSATILLFGAELTQSCSRARGRGILPDDHAERAT